MNGSNILWRNAKHARRMQNWAPRLMLAEARLRALINGFGAPRHGQVSLSAKGASPRNTPRRRA